MKKLWQIIKYIITYLYLFLGYSFIIYYLFFNVRIAENLEEWLAMMLFVLLFFIMYTAINHIFTRRVIAQKLLITIEALLLVSIFTLIISDLRYEQYQHNMYLKRNNPVIVTPGGAR